MGPSDGLIEEYMSCQFIQESISSYLDNRLEEQERKTVDRHLAACVEVRRAP